MQNVIVSLIKDQMRDVILLLICNNIQYSWCTYVHTARLAKTTERTGIKACYKLVHATVDLA